MEELNTTYNDSMDRSNGFFGRNARLQLTGRPPSGNPTLRPIGRLERSVQHPSQMSDLQSAMRQSTILGDDPEFDSTSRSQGRQMMADIFNNQLRRNLSRNAREQSSVIRSSHVRWADETDIEVEEAAELPPPYEEDQRSSSPVYNFPLVPRGQPQESTHLEPAGTGLAMTRPSHNIDQAAYRAQLDPEYDDIEDNWFAEAPTSSGTGSKRIPYDFLEPSLKGTATLTFNDASGSLISIHDLNIAMIEARSALLATAFEAADPRQQLHLDIVSSRSAEPMLRYLYTGGYADENDVDTSLLLHSELHFVASIFNMQGLKSQALMNVNHNLQYACSSPAKPIDLYEAITYCYAHPENVKLIENILEYIISMFYEHHFEDDPAFLSLHHDHRQFQIDLAKANNARAACGEAVNAIVRLTVNTKPFEHYQSYEDPTNRRLQDVVHFFHSSDGFEETTSSKQAGKPKVGAQEMAIRAKSLDNPPVLKRRTLGPGVSALALELRGTPADELSGFQSDSTEGQSEDEGFHVVRAASESGASESGASTPTKESGFVLVKSSARDSDSEASPRALRRRRVAERSDESDSEAFSSDSDWTMA